MLPQAALCHCIALIQAGFCDPAGVANEFKVPPYRNL
jgi:hypothetical protein